MKLLRVTFVGLLPKQAKVIEDKLNGKAMFHFIDKNRKKIESIPNNQDIIIVFAKFVKHSIQDQINKVTAGTKTKVIVHHGGTDIVINKLNELLS